MNFYFAVEIQYKIDSDTGSTTVYLAQGSYGSFYDPTNNWWIGGSAIDYIGAGPQLVLTAGLQSVNLALSGSNDTFVVS